MHAILTNLTAVLLVIHAMIGCCHHHWPSDAVSPGGTTNVAAARHCSDHCDGSNCGSQQSSEPCDAELECHGICSYLPTQKATIDASPSDGAFDFAPLIPTLHDGRLHVGLPWDRAHTLDDSPPLRLHLWHQILLI